MILDDLYYENVESQVVNRTVSKEAMVGRPVNA
jgi:(2Fe-2S) ferredoxin